MKKDSADSAPSTKLTREALEKFMSYGDTNMDEITAYFGVKAREVEKFVKSEYGIPFVDFYKKKKQHIEQT